MSYCSCCLETTGKDGGLIQIEMILLFPDAVAVVFLLLSLLLGNNRETTRIGRRADSNTSDTELTRTTLQCHILLFSSHLVLSLESETHFLSETPFLSETYFLSYTPFLSGGTFRCIYGSWTLILWSQIKMQQVIKTLNPAVNQLRSASQSIKCSTNIPSVLCIWFPLKNFF